MASLHSPNKGGKAWSLSLKLAAETQFIKETSSLAPPQMIQDLPPCNVRWHASFKMFSRSVLALLLSQVSSSLERYSPAIAAWETVPPMLVRRVGHVADCCPEFPKTSCITQPWALFATLPQLMKHLHVHFQP
eukprot:1343361-Amphidinium_carterae.1